MTNGRTLWVWITIVVFFVGLAVSTGLKWNQIDINKENIDCVEVKAEKNEKDIIRFEERFDNIDKSLDRILDKLDK